MAAAPRKRAASTAAATRPTPKPKKGGTTEDKALVLARENRAVALKIAGMTYAQIAQQLGYADGSGVRTAVLRALTREQAESVDELRTLEAQRLDRLQAAVWQAAMGGDTAAVRTALRVSERRAKLLGLDAPLKLEVSDGVDEQITALRLQLAQDELRIVDASELLPDHTLDTPHPSAAGAA